MEPEQALGVGGWVLKDLVSNNASTCHKLQGSSVDKLYVPSWSYQPNWVYVMISRVRRLDGLFIGRPLDPTKDFSVPERLTGMLRMFRRHKSPAARLVWLCNPRVNLHDFCVAEIVAAGKRDWSYLLTKNAGSRST